MCPCITQGSLIFVVGKIEGLLMVSGRRHNADDLVATALAVEPVKTVYRGRCVFAPYTKFIDTKLSVFIINSSRLTSPGRKKALQGVAAMMQGAFIVL